MFNELDTERTFNVIDDILVEAQMTNHQTDDLLLKARTGHDKIYTKTASDNDDPVGTDYAEQFYADTEQTEEGYVGLPFAPMN